MVMILRKSLDAQAPDADPVASRCFDSEPRPPEKMSHGPTLFSCGGMENDRWRDLDRKCPLQMDAPSAGLWERLPARCPDGALWPPEAASAGTVTSLIRDLSLSDRRGTPSAPPSKRQCRSLSFSDGLSGGRPSWRPLGSRVWTPVEKRRCLSGGSVPRAAGPGPVQRSSSFSLPSRPAARASPASPGDPAASPRRPGGQAGPGDPWSPGRGPAGGRLDMQRSRSCSHEQFAFAELSACSSPASTPKLARRPGGLARSRSQPCVLSDRKAGVKRRRPEEGPEPRPSLDLAKMAQNCQAFSSLSLSSGMEDRAPHSPFALHVGSTRAWAALFSAAGPGGRTPAGTPVPEPPAPSVDALACTEELCWEEAEGGAPGDGCGRRGEPAPAWRDRGAQSSPCSLDGELDIEQIENN
ncbi:protein FAM53B isoform X1 [Pipistrellus kuhlii]|uniref:Family with sequence similarity 53 member B n=2 Tax=Pipistrellus kuhlii TaxID=59472 RepID=A0A7J7VB96_PIPKU|nr:protein FAM53B isoform X1 [Pipistrellus kuhlii]KAF6322291.1 family with sequence similarity 53 member B [Pipistrellus kuhlii]